MITLLSDDSGFLSDAIRQVEWNAGVSFASSVFLERSSSTEEKNGPYPKDGYSPCVWNERVGWASYFFLRKVLSRMTAPTGRRRRISALNAPDPIREFFP